MRHKIHAAKPGAVFNTALCGKAPIPEYSTTTNRKIVNCAQCARMWEKHVPAIGTCHTCGAKLWDWDRNPCDLCNPHGVPRPATAAEETDYNRNAILMERGASVGWHHVPQPGYGTCTTSAEDGQLSPYLGHLVEGGWVIDKAPISKRENFLGLVFDAPLCDPALADTAMVVCPSPSGMLVAGLCGEYQRLSLKKILQPSWKGMDSISVPAYLAYWREAGAKIGRRKGHVIEWENGERQEIPSFSSRWVAAL